MTATRRIAFMTGPPLRYHSSTVFISAFSEEPGFRSARQSFAWQARARTHRRLWRCAALHGRGEAGGVPDGGRDTGGCAREAESAVARMVESARIPATVRICSGGRIDGQKSRSKNAGTKTRRLYAGA